MKQAVSDENSFINRNIFELKRTDRRCNMVKPSIDGFRQNKILKNLGDEDLHVLAPHLELVQLSVHQRLFEYGCNSAHVYFPTTAIISLLFILLDGSSTEISVAGNEGMVGISALMGETALGNAVVQSAGYAYRLKASVMKQEYRRGGVLQRTMMRYMQVLFAQMAQNCVCSRHYSIE
ncbi:hypothetical protein RGU72_20615 [Undibacterium sp. 5I1]|nr:MULTISPECIES: hypothetical protein [unclassified Undibacterium]MDY7540660.1 hypothetical protein [Undibacterium sp. 5I1]MEB0232389.1 hypothetical protein [Undibacterium sp. 10I3]MEB0259556.1 hypothetical protein [Undibacterium sp. 5I1]